MRGREVSSSRRWLSSERTSKTDQADNDLNLVDDEQGTTDLARGGLADPERDDGREGADSETSDEAERSIDHQEAEEEGAWGRADRPTAICATDLADAVWMTTAASDNDVE